MLKNIFKFRIWIPNLSSTTTCDVFDLFLRPFWGLLCRDHSHEPVHSQSLLAAFNSDRSISATCLLIWVGFSTLPLGECICHMLFVVIISFQNGQGESKTRFKMNSTSDKNEHSSEIRGLRSTKCSSETLQNLLYFMYKKTHVVLFVFRFVQLYIFTLKI